MKKRVTLEKKRRALKKVTFIGSVYLSAVVSLCIITSCMNNEPLKPGLTTDPTVQLIQEKCSTCHTLDKVRDYQGDDWKEVVADMIDKGTKLAEDEAANIIDHLKEGKSF